MNDINDELETPHREQKQWQELNNKFASYCPDNRIDEFVDMIQAFIVFPPLNIRDKRLRNQTDRGFPSAVNRELKSIRAAIARLSPATRWELKYREAIHYAEPSAKNHYTHKHGGVIWFGSQDCLTTLEAITVDEFSKDTTHDEKHLIMSFAVNLWEIHGGKVTASHGHASKERKRKFAPFLEYLLKEIGKSYDVVEEVRSYLNKRKNGPI